MAKGPGKVKGFEPQRTQGIGVEVAENICRVFSVILMRFWMGIEN